MKKQGPLFVLLALIFAFVLIGLTAHGQDDSFETALGQMWKKCSADKMADIEPLLRTQEYCSGRERTNSESSSGVEDVVDALTLGTAYPMSSESESCSTSETYFKCMTGVDTYDPSDNLNKKYRRAGNGAKWQKYTATSGWSVWQTDLNYPLCSDQDRFNGSDEDDSRCVAFQQINVGGNDITNAKLRDLLLKNWNSDQWGGVKWSQEIDFVVASADPQCPKTHIFFKKINQDWTPAKEENGEIGSRIEGRGSIKECSKDGASYLDLSQYHADKDKWFTKLSMIMPPGNTIAPFKTSQETYLTCSDEDICWIKTPGLKDIIKVYLSADKKEYRIDETDIMLKDISRPDVYYYGIKGDLIYRIRSLKMEDVLTVNCFSSGSFLPLTNYKAQNMSSLPQGDAVEIYVKKEETDINITCMLRSGGSGGAIHKVKNINASVGASTQHLFDGEDGINATHDNEFSFNWNVPKDSTSLGTKLQLVLWIESVNMRPAGFNASVNVDGQTFATNVIFIEEGNLLCEDGSGQCSAPDCGADAVWNVQDNICKCRDTALSYNGTFKKCVAPESACAGVEGSAYDFGTDSCVCTSAEKTVVQNRCVCDTAKNLTADGASCKCKDGFERTAEDFNMCVERVIENECEEGCAEGSVCQNNVCVDNGEVEAVKKAFGESCQTEDECDEEQGLSCFNEKCACDTDNEWFTADTQNHPLEACINLPGFNGCKEYNFANKVCLDTVEPEPDPAPDPDSDSDPDPVINPVTERADEIEPSNGGCALGGAMSLPQNIVTILLYMLPLVMVMRLSFLRKGKFPNSSPPL